VHTGTLAIKSEARAKASALAKPPTMVTISRATPNILRASSIGPVPSPTRDTDMCLPHSTWRHTQRADLLKHGIEGVQQVEILC
jgi:hypothetical protein